MTDVWEKELWVSLRGGEERILNSSRCDGLGHSGAFSATWPPLEIGEEGAMNIVLGDFWNAHRC